MATGFIDGPRVQAIVEYKLPEERLVYTKKGRIRRVRSFTMELRRNSQHEPWRIVEVKMSRTITRPTEDLPAGTRSYSYGDMNNIDMDDPRNAFIGEAIDAMVNTVTEDSKNHA